MRSTTTRIPGITTVVTPSITLRDEGGADPGSHTARIGRLTLAALAGIGVVLVVLSIPRIVSGAFILSHEPAIRLMQRNAEVPVDRLLAAQRAYEAAIAWHAGADERVALASLRRR